MSAQQHGVNFIELLVGPTAEPLFSALLVGCVVAASGMYGLKKLRQADNPLIPDDKLTVKNFWELLSFFILKLGDTAMGRNNRKYLPFVGSLFVYLLTLNLLGLIPGFSMPTDSVSFNLGIALTVFVLYNAWGIRAVGVSSYLKHLWGPIWWIGPLLFVVELISHCVRPVALSLRLYGNMTGDHVVLAIFTDLTRGIYIPVPVIFYFLGLFVCVMQAFVFTLLSMIYIRLAVAHEEEH